MPKLQVKITEVEESVSRPLIFDITRQIFKLTGLKSDTPIQYGGPLEEVKQPGSEIASNPQNAFNTFHQGEKVIVKANESVANDDTNNVMTQSVHRAETFPFFIDKDLKIVVKPIYRNAALELEFEYRGVDETSAKAWRDDMIVRLGEGRTNYLMTGTYHYMFPLEYLAILKEIYRMREKVAGYGDTWEEYVESHSLSTLTKISNQSGSKTNWAFSEKQIRIVGNFAFDDGPSEGSNQDGGSTWTTSFTFNLHYMKPVQAAMSYPLMFHNQLIDQKYRPYDRPYEIERQQRHYTHSGAYLNYFEGVTIANELQRFQGYQIPNFDEFLPDSVIQKTMRVITGLCQLDPDNPSFMMDLRDLGAYEFCPGLMDFFVKEAPFMPFMYRSVFQLTLYEGNGIQAIPALRVDPDLKIYATNPVSFRKYYHVRLSIVTDWNLLDAAAIARLQQSGNILKCLLDTLAPGHSTGTLPGNIDGSVPPSDIDKIKDILSQRKPIPRLMNTVETLFIQVFRGSDAPH